MKLAFRQHKKTNNIHYWNKYQTLRNKEIIELRKSKQFYSHNLDKLLSSSDCNSKMFWKISKQILNLGQTSTSILTLHHNSIYAESDFDKAKMLNTYFSSHSVVDYTNKQLPPIPHINHSIESITITTQDVSNVFQHLDIIKACGPDSISPRLLKEGCYILAHPYSIILTALLNKDTSPRHGKTLMSPQFTKKKTNHYLAITYLQLLSKLFIDSDFCHNYLHTLYLFESL